MPVQIPTLKRFDPGVEAQPESGKVVYNAPNLTASSEQVAKDVEVVGSEQEQFFLRAKEAAAQNKANELANPYEAMRRGQIGALRKLQGDPTQPYADADTAAKAAQDKIFADNKDLDERTQFLLKERFQSVDRRSADTLSLQQAVQSQAWNKQVADTSVDNAQDMALNYSSLLATGDPHAMDKYSSALDAIRQPLINLGRQNGLVTYKDNPDQLDENGKPTKTEVYSPVLDRQMKVAVGKAVQNTIQTLNATGATGPAKQLFDRYKDELTSQQQEALQKDHSAAMIRTDASSIADKLRGLSAEEAIRRINADPNMNPEVRQKSISIVYANASAQEKAIELKQKQAYNQASQYVNNRGFTSIEQMRDDPFMSKTLPNLDQKQRDALLQQVAAPKTTDPQAKARIMDLVQSNKMTGMSANDMLLQMRDLNTADRDKAWNQWTAANHPDSAKSFRIAQHMTAQADQLMLQAGLIKRSASGGFTKASLETRNAMYDKIQDAASTLPPNASPADVDRMVHNLVGQGVKATAFTPPAADTIQSSPQPTSTPSAGPKAVTTPLTRGQQMAVVKAFQSINGRPYSLQKDGPIQAFIQKQGGIDKLTKTYGGQ